MPKRERKQRNPNGSGTIGPRKDGRFELKLFVDAPDGRRKRISVYGVTWDEADAERTRLKELQRKGMPVDVTTVTVGQYLKHWLEDVAQQQVRPTTYRSYEQLVRLYLVPGLGRKKLRVLQAQQVRTWLSGLASQCQCCVQGKDARRTLDPDDPSAVDVSKARCCARIPKDCCEQCPSAGTRRALLRVLRAALQHAVNEEELVSRNVARQVRMPARDERRPREWTAQEAALFLTEARKDRLHALWVVALSLGLRRGEALGLRWVDVDFVRGRLDIAQALHRVGGETIFLRPKTDSSESWVPLTPEMVRLLRQRRDDQRANTIEAKANRGGLVFTTKNGTPLSPRNINRAFERLCRRAGVRRIRLHDLRHSCATLLFTQGVDAATVQRILRHSSITVTTSTYMKVIEEVRRDALGGMDALVKGGDDEIA
ncbi:MAG: integrase [Nocardia sp.]|uniref:tyrosine-type recombinase/integrase n=1 Tax=Nocardia sp. TaxID=1821 RepID=UPI0026178BD4|nr:site-specific integrase [Nocardia sp.]MCU1641208.1 integrase [Nocardia sp.]